MHHKGARTPNERAGGALKRDDHGGGAHGGHGGRLRRQPELETTPAEIGEAGGSSRSARARQSCVPEELGRDGVAAANFATNGVVQAAAERRERKRWWRLGLLSARATREGATASAWPATAKLVRVRARGGGKTGAAAGGEHTGAWQLLADQQ